MTVSDEKETADFAYRSETNRFAGAPTTERSVDIGAIPSRGVDVHHWLSACPDTSARRYERRADSAMRDTGREAFETKSIY